MKVCLKIAMVYEACLIKVAYCANNEIQLEQINKAIRLHADIYERRKWSFIFEIIAAYQNVQMCILYANISVPCGG